MLDIARYADDPGEPPVTSFSGQYAVFSMFHRCPVYWDGIEYPGGEWAFQAAKTLDPQLRYRILAMASGGEAKAYGRALACRPDWDQVKRLVMIGVNAAKYLQNPGLAAILAATGDRVLIEGNHWGDWYWGAIRAASKTPNPGRPVPLPVWSWDPDPRTWLAGHNWLGRTLMTVRTALQGEG